MYIYFPSRDEVERMKEDVDAPGDESREGKGKEEGEYRRGNRDLRKERFGESRSVRKDIRLGRRRRKGDAVCNYKRYIQPNQTKTEMTQKNSTTFYRDTLRYLDTPKYLCSCAVMAVVRKSQALQIPPADTSCLFLFPGLRRG
jgi:hypothetical protein